MGFRFTFRYRFRFMLGLGLGVGLGSGFRMQWAGMRCNGMGWDGRGC